ncbi:MAG: glutaminyl-peptide cyclotransferase [Deltaproteobacteria bacterium]|nr:glutaminyl-peptide cyclotransferase [Deltaproteobacteria bacterium]
MNAPSPVCRSIQSVIRYFFNLVAILLFLGYGRPQPCLSEPATTVAANQNEADNSVTSEKSRTEEIPLIYSYKVISVYPHDHNAFTQGLVFDNGFLYEGTGRRGQSSVRKICLTTGEVLMGYRLAPRYFGEGITIFKDRLIQLTWQAHQGFVYDKQTLALMRSFTLSTEGWGLTHDGKSLIVSDGTSTLHYLDPEDFRGIGKIDVYDNNGPVSLLNELEYVKGEIYANIWKTTRIARISPENGRVVGWIDLTGLYSQHDTVYKIDVLNGIAYDVDHDRLFVTGKLWPHLFEIAIMASQ